MASYSIFHSCRWFSCVQCSWWGQSWSHLLTGFCEAFPLSRHSCLTLPTYLPHSASFPHPATFPRLVLHASPSLLLSPFLLPSSFSMPHPPSFSHPAFLSTCLTLFTYLPACLTLPSFNTSSELLLHPRLTKSHLGLPCLTLLYACLTPPCFTPEYLTFDRFVGFKIYTTSGTWTSG